jgi:hypothetical protein
MNSLALNSVFPTVPQATPPLVGNHFDDARVSLMSLWDNVSQGVFALERKKPGKRCSLSLLAR